MDHARQRWVEQVLRTLLAPYFFIIVSDVDDEALPFPQFCDDDDSPVLLMLLMMMLQ